MPVDVVVESPGEGLAEEAGEGLAEAAKAAAEFLLEALARGDHELTVSLVADQRIRELNRDYRGADRITDVLAFAQLEGEETISGGPPLLGDVVVSVETAARQAGAGGWTVAEETVRLILHGLLHLLGYDHERGAADEAAMKAEEQRLAAALNATGLPCAGEEEEV